MTETEKISDDDLSYHLAVVAKVKAAQRANEEIQRLQALVLNANGAVTSWSSHLSEKYKIGANDAIDENGIIHRKKQY